MAALTVDFRKHSGPTPADDMAAKSSLTGNFTLDFKQHGFCASPLFLQTLGPWFPKCKITFIWKEDFGPLSNSPVIFSLAQVRCFWRCCCFRSGWYLFLKMSERGDSWCTDSSFSSLLWSSPKCLNQLCLTILKVAVIPVACAHFPTQFLPSVNFAFNMLWYSTPWTATPFSNDPLWLTLFVEGVNDCLLDHCQVSSVPHYCGFKEQEILRIYTVWMVIYWNSNVNILIFWDTDFWLSLAVSSNHQINKKKAFEVFYFTCNESKIYEHFTFLSYKKKWMFSPYSNFLRCTCPEVNFDFMQTLRIIMTV